MGAISSSRVLLHPRIARTILTHTPTLDPLTILCNNVLISYIIDGKIVSFVAIKRYGKSYELGTVYTYPKHRKQGYAAKLIAYAVNKYQPIGLLCKKGMVSYYEKSGFQQNNKNIRILQIRRKLFNIFLRPLVGHNIVSMIYRST